MAVDVEVNLQIGREKLKVEEEEKLDILIKKIEEMIHKITMKVEFFDTFVSQKEEVDIREQIPTNSIYHRLEDRFIEPYVER